MNIDNNKVNFRHIFLIYLRKGKNAVQTRNNICKIYRDCAVAASTVRKLFTQFEIGDFNLEDRSIDCYNIPRQAILCTLILFWFNFCNS